MHHKALLAPDSCMNEDGSTFMQGIGVVPASSMKEALELFEAYLADKKMSLLKLWRCEEWSPQNFTEVSSEHKQINDAVVRALKIKKIHYTCGISSEALDCEDR